ncbi:GAF domain-containing protein [Altericista sp. CCNU0014]|uniref:GAF domain-containing protein n=1 Tax=Altericista sp. CCNU0014 TaxID=3082949 RepID=UPI00384AE9B5
MQALNSNNDRLLSQRLSDSPWDCSVASITLKIAESLSINEILNIATQSLQKLLDVDRVAIYQFDENARGAITAECKRAGWSAALGMEVESIFALQSGARQERRFSAQAIDRVEEASFVEGYSAILSQQQVKSCLMMPLTFKGRDLGAIVAHHCARTHLWETLEIQVVERVSQHVACALGRALQAQQQQQQIRDLQRSEQVLLEKNYQLKTLVSQQNLSGLQANIQLKHKIAELEQSYLNLELQTTKSQILKDFILKIRQSLDLEEILYTTTSEIQSCLQTDRILIYRVNPNGDGKVIAESVAPGWPSTMGAEFPAALFSPQCQQNLIKLPYKAIQDVVEAYQTVNPPLLEALTSLGTKATAIVPILNGSTPWGFIMAHQCSGTRAWNPPELDLLTQVAAHVSISIEQAELNQRRQRALEIGTRAEQILLVQQEQIGYVLSSSPGILYSCLAQDNGQRIFFGKNLHAQLGYSSLDTIETDFWIDRIHPEDRPRVQVLSDRPIVNQEYRFLHSDGTYRWLYDQQKVVYDESGKPLERIGYCVDISDRKEIEEQLKASLVEKEILLQEIHHRVKNNLNVIISLLNLQASYVDDDTIVDMFIDSQSRICTMAMIHEQLYGSENLAQLNFADYVKDLVNHLFMASQSATAAEIELCIDIPDIDLNLETATPCGLILNELVTNAFKHAFSDGRPGKISISLTRHARELQLIVQDNGKGFAPNIDWHNCPTLGLRLVRLLARQLDATLTQTADTKGTCFCLTFSELAYEARL